MADYDKDGQRDTLFGFYDWLTDIHPKSEAQFRHQKITAGFLPWYGDWMESRSLDERNRNTRQYYGIKFSDIAYPWLSSLTSNNADTASVSAVKRTWSYSRNMASLYVSATRSPRKRSKNRSRRYRRY